jgi:hypothetical protein
LSKHCQNLFFKLPEIICRYNCTKIQQSCLCYELVKRPILYFYAGAILYFYAGAILYFWAGVTSIPTVQRSSFRRLWFGQLRSISVIEFWNQLWFWVNFSDFSRFKEVWRHSFWLGVITKCSTVFKFWIWLIFILKFLVENLINLP